MTENTDVSSPSTDSFVRPLFTGDTNPGEAPVPTNKADIDNNTTEAPGFERPVTKYQEDHGRPLVADILDIGSVFEHAGMGKEVHNIDSFILGEIEKRDLKANESTYRKLYYELSDRLGLDSDINFDTLLRKMDAYVSMERRLSTEEQMRQLLG